MIKTLGELIAILRQQNQDDIIIFRKGDKLAYPIRRRLVKDFLCFGDGVCMPKNFFHCYRGNYADLAINFSESIEKAKKYYDVKTFLDELENSVGYEFVPWKGGCLIPTYNTKIYLCKKPCRSNGSKIQLSHSEDGKIYFDVIQPPWLEYDENIDYIKKYLEIDYHVCVKMEDDFYGEST